MPSTGTSGGRTDVFEDILASVETSSRHLYKYCYVLSISLNVMVGSQCTQLLVFDGSYMFMSHILQVLCIIFHV